MPKLSVIEAQGNESEPGSRSTPTQVPLRMSDVQLEQAMTALFNLITRALEWVAGRRCL